MKELSITKYIVIISLLLALGGGLWYFKVNRANIGEVVLSHLLGLVNKDDHLNSLIVKLAGFSGEKKYLILFQNNLELRPAGGYIGNFGIATVQNGKIKSLETHDTNIFDGFGKVQTAPPEAMAKYLGVDNWQMRDSNWSPDFAESAQQAIDFYHLQGGEHQFDGVIGLTATVLPELVKLTGPIELTQYDLKFDSTNILYQLEYEVEKNYVQRGFADGDRKLIFKELIEAILTKLGQGNLLELLDLKDLALDQLAQKGVVLYLADSALQKQLIALNWAGQVDQDYLGDYLMIVEANLGGRKSNYFLSRRVDYNLDFSEQIGQANLRVTFTHAGEQNDWFNHDYLAYVRLYVPEGSWLNSISGSNSEVQFFKQFNKTVFGFWLEVPTGQAKTVELNYSLPQPIVDNSFYKILVQKQVGVNELPFVIQVKGQQNNFKKEKVIANKWEGGIFLEQ